VCRAGAILLLVLCWAGPATAWGSYEDFTRTGLWIETDAGGKLAVNSSGAATSATVSESVGARLEANFGTDSYGDFEFQFTGSHGGSWSTYSQWRMGVSDSGGFWPDADAGDSVWLKLYNDGDYDTWVSVVSVNGGTPTESDTFEIFASTPYYITFSRSGTTLSVACYSDAGRTQHISGSPVSVSCIATQLEYCHVWNAYSGSSKNVPWDIAGFDQNRAPAQTTTFYVDGANGDDTYDGLYIDHSGGLDHGPFKTIGNAVTFWRVGAGSTVYLRGGTYAETAAFGKGGSVGSPLTLARYQSETPILDGSYPIPKASWTACTEAADALGNANWANMYYCTLPAGPTMNSNLYQGADWLNIAQDCEPTNRFDYYNETYWHRRETGVTRTTITDANLPTYGGADLVGGYVAMRTTSNTVGQGLITNWNSGTDTITFDDVGANPEQDEGGTGKYIYALFNSPADYQFEDAGEYVIGADRYCVVWPWDSTDLTTADDGTVTVTVRGYQLNLGTHDYITIDGLTFRRGYQKALYGTGDHYIVKNCTFAECCGLDGTAVNHIHLEGGGNTFEDNSLSYGRGQLRGLVSSGSDSVWSGNTVDTYSGTCLYSAGGDRNQIIDNTVRNGTGAHINAIAVQYCADKCLIARNKIVDTCRLTLSYSFNVIICHNIFDHAAWDAYWLSDNGGGGGYLRVFNNTMLGPGDYYFLKHLSSSWDSSTFKNNLIDSSSASPSVHTYNVFTSDNHWTLDGTESVNYTESSLIVDWGGEDYTPVEDGDLHDAGTAVEDLFDASLWPGFNFALDQEGNLRTGTWDIGAVERGGDAPPTYYLLMRSGS